MLAVIALTFFHFGRILIQIVLQNLEILINSDVATLLKATVEVLVTAVV